jgi:hypothetical protein
VEEVTDVQKQKPAAPQQAGFYLYSEIVMVDSDSS